MTSWLPRIDWQDLAAVLDECIELLRRPDLDLSWSSYRTAAAAIEELDGLRRRVLDHDRLAIRDLGVHFTVTGPLQEASLSSGWGQRFVDLADRFDRASGAVP